MVPSTELIRGLRAPARGRWCRYRSHPSSRLSPLLCRCRLSQAFSGRYGPVLAPYDGFRPQLSPFGGTCGRPHPLRRAGGYARGVQLRPPLGVEVALARGAGRLSQLARAGGGTTLPGKLLMRVDPSALERLAARLAKGSALVSATNGKTTTTSMAAEILRPRVRLAHNSSGANLVSGVASTLLAANGAQLGLFEVDEAALPEVARRVRPRALCLGNLFRDQLDRYGELEHVAERWRALARELDPATTLVVNGDDPQVGDLVHERPGSVVFGLDD